MDLQEMLDGMELSYEAHEMGIDSYVYMINEKDVNGYSTVIRADPTEGFSVSLSTKLIPSSSAEGESLLQLHDRLQAIGSTKVPENRYEGIGDYIDYTVIVKCETEEDAINALETLTDGFGSLIGDVSDYDYIWTKLDENVREYQVQLNYSDLEKIPEL